MTEEIKCFLSIDELTLYRWDRYTVTRDNNWFLVDYDGRQKKVNSDELKEIENKIIDQYFKAIDDRSFSNKMQKWGEIDCLKTKYATCQFLLAELETTICIDCNEHQLYLAERRHNLITELKKWGLKFPELNSVYADSLLISEFRTVLEGIKTQIAIISNELKESGQKETQGLYRQITIAKSILQGYEMNPRIMVVAEWIEICKVLQERSKNN